MCRVTFAKHETRKCKMESYPYDCRLMKCLILLSLKEQEYNSRTIRLIRRLTRGYEKSDKVHT